MIDADLHAFLETCALIASTEEYNLQDFLEACAEAYCEVHNTVLVSCEMEVVVEDKPEAN